MGVRAERIPEHIVAFEAAVLYPAIESFFQDPKNQREFEKWQKARKERNEGKNNSDCCIGSGVVAGGLLMAARA